MNTLRHLKRAILSVGKQLRKSVLMLLLITTVLTMIMVGTSIQKAVEQASLIAKDAMRAEVIIKLDLEKLTQIPDKDEPSHDKIDINNNMLEKIKNIKHVTGTQVSLQSFILTDLEEIKLVNKKTFREELLDGSIPTIEGGMPEGYNFPTNHIYGFDAKEDNEKFASGIHKLVEGNMPYESDVENPVIMTKKLAEKNHLKIGDTVNVKGGISASKDITYTISGFFEVKSTKQSKLMESILADSPEYLPDNTFYSTSKVVEKTLTLDDPTQPVRYENIKVIVDNVENIRSVIDELKKDSSTNWDYISFESDFDQYDKVTAAINKVASISMLLLWIAGISGVVILSLIMVLSFRDRKFEIGVLLSIGEAKMGIVLQMLTEVFIIFTCAFILAIGVSSASAHKIGDSLVSNEVTSLKKIAEEEKQAGTETMTILAGIEHREQMEAETIEKINVEVINTRVLITSFGLGLSIIFISTLLPLSLVLRKDPKAIMLDKE